MPVQPESTAGCTWYSSAARPDRRGLDAQRHVLGDERDVASLGGEVQRDGQDARVVAAEPEAGRQPGQVGVVELDVQAAAVVADRHRGVQPAVPHPQVVEHPQRLPGEAPELGVVPLALQLADHHQRQHDLVLGEPPQRPRVGEQDGRVEDERAHGGRMEGSTSSERSYRDWRHRRRRMTGGSGCPGR